MTNEELIGIRVSIALIEKVKKKLNCHPSTPAVYAVDQALREFVKDSREEKASERIF